MKDKRKLIIIILALILLLLSIVAIFLMPINISGKYFSPLANNIDLSQSNIVESPSALAKKLNRFHNLSQCILCDSNYNNEDIEQLIAECPNIKFTWTVMIGKWPVRTDSLAFSTLQMPNAEYQLTSKECENLKYCSELRLLDIGHNSVADYEFLKYLPNLKILIVADNRDPATGKYITDLSGIKYCDKLKYLEIFMTNVSDLSFLEGMSKLKDLNICYTPVADISYLTNLPSLERLYITGTAISEEDYTLLVNKYPSANICNLQGSSVDNGWREHPRYFAMKRMIEYNIVDPLFQD